jgi:hypothetical protein
MIQLERLEKLLDDLMATATEINKEAARNFNNVPPRLRDRLLGQIEAARALLAEARGQQSLTL